MPRKPRKQRIRRGGSEIKAAARWYFTIIRFIEPLLGKYRSKVEVQKYWLANKSEIIRLGLSLMRERGEVAKRPCEYWDELEAEHPRLKIGTENWLGPQFSPAPRVLHRDSIYEDDKTYLKRLGLLEKWEKQTRRY